MDCTKFVEFVRERNRYYQFYLFLFFQIYEAINRNLTKSKESNYRFYRIDSSIKISLHFVYRSTSSKPFAEKILIKGTMETLVVNEARNEEEINNFSNNFYFVIAYLYLVTSILIKRCLSIAQRCYKGLESRRRVINILKNE